MDRETNDITVNVAAASEYGIGVFFRIKDFNKYFSDFLKNEALDHTVLGYPSFIKIQEEVHNRLRLFPDYYETHEISSYNDKLIPLV